MRELSLHILDICQNSTKAGAGLVRICLKTEGGILTIRIEDDGCGMNEQLLKRVTDPFATTRTTRKVGMGIPLFKMASEMAGGSFTISSKVGEGTTVTATFEIDHIDRMPLGNMGSTMRILIASSVGVRFVLTAEKDGESFTLDTQEVSEIMGGISIYEDEVLKFIEDFVRSNIECLYGGNI